MKLKVITFLLLFFLISVGQSANPAGMIKISESEFPGMEITTTDFYGNDQLYGYMDGGAELYREYGFDQLLVQELNYENEKYAVEIFKMITDLAAFGIYSVSTHRCDSQLKTIPNSCVTKYRTAFSKGDFYITITNYAASEVAINFSKRIAENLADKIVSPKMKYPDIKLQLEKIGNISDMKYFAGNIAVQNRIAYLTDWFTGLDSTKIWQYDFVLQTANYTLLQFNFKSDANYHKFLKVNQLSANSNNWQKWAQEGNTYFLLKSNSQQMFLISGISQEAVLKINLTE